jgi:hypothetical protein
MTSMDASAAIAEARSRLLAAADDVEIRESFFYRNIIDNLTLATRSMPKMRTGCGRGSAAW